MSPVRLASTAIEFIFQANPGLAKGRVTEKSSVLGWRSTVKEIAVAVKSALLNTLQKASSSNTSMNPTNLFVRN